MFHTPVLLKEVLEWLAPQPGQKFIDATTDGGGHALAVLEKIQPNGLSVDQAGKLLGIEWDRELLEQLKLKVENIKFKNSLVLVNDSYINLKKIVEEKGFTEADGILFDLGMSSWHLSQSNRGFSFQKDELLDMRFNAKTELPALEIINTFSEKDLEKIISKYGEEKFADRIAMGIVGARRGGIIKTTLQLAEIIKKSTPQWYGNRRIHPATKTFQALRIAVNGELENIAKGLDSAIEVLKRNGRMAIISFHALEDRIIKQKFREYQKAGLVEVLTKKAISARYEEARLNPRARSAKLRVCKKL